MIFTRRGKLRTEGGQGLVEYSLVLLLKALVAVAGLMIFGLMNRYLTFSNIM